MKRDLKRRIWGSNMAAMTQREQAPFKFTGWHMLAAMVAFFGVIISVNLTMAMLANGTWTGLVVKNSYVASQEFNEHLAEVRDQEARGWASKVAYEDGKILVEVTDRSAKGVVVQDLKALVGRPAFEQQDYVIALQHRGDGRYEVATKLAPGEWLIKIGGGEGPTAYRHDVRLFVPAGADDQSDNPS